jgi:aminopeptidase N
VLSIYRVRMIGDKATFPVLLSNGNCEATGDNGDGTHWAEWIDPWPKPSYLFALVAGDLVETPGAFITGRPAAVKLASGRARGRSAPAPGAVRSLVNSMEEMGGGNLWPRL